MVIKFSSNKIWIYQPYALSLRYKNRAAESRRLEIDNPNTTSKKFGKLIKLL